MVKFCRHVYLSVITFKVRLACEANAVKIPFPMLAHIMAMTIALIIGIASFFNDLYFCMGVSLRLEPNDPLDHGI